MAYETEPAGTSDEVAVLFDTDSLIARRRAVHQEMGEVSAAICTLQQRHIALVAESIALNGQLAGRSVDTAELARELHAIPAEDVA
jgi:hypothetical protein